MLHIDEEEAPLRPQNKQARDRLVIGMAGGQRPQHILPGFSANHIDGRLRRLAGEPQQGGQDGDHYPLQGAKQQHPQAGDGGPAKLHHADLPYLAKLPRLDEPHRIDDDHHRQGGARQPGEQRGEEDHGGQRHSGGDGGGPLAQAPDGAHHGGLGGPAPRRHAAAEGAPQVGQPGGHQLAVRIDLGLSLAHEGPACGYGLGEAHQRYARRPRQQLQHQGQVRHRQGGQAGGDAADDGDTRIVQAKTPHQGNAYAHPQQGGGGMGEAPLHEHQHHQGDEGDHQGQPGALGQGLSQVVEIQEEVLLLDVHPEQLGQLIEDDHQPYAALESHQHRQGDEVGHEAEPQHRRQHQHGPHQQGQGGGHGEQPTGIPIRHHQPELGRGQDSQRAGGADAEHPGGAQQGVEQHGHQGGVETDGHRQTGHAGIGHGLGQHDGRGSDTGQQIGQGAPWRRRG